MASAAKKCFCSKVMGKSRKFSKCNATGFAPDFQHDVGTFDESEGFGNSGKIDTELKGSGGSCAPNKKKCFSLNVDDFDFDVRSRVLSIYKMSPSERMELKMRLEKYLYIVSKVQEEIDGINSNPIVLSPHIDIRNCPEGQKRPPLKSQHSILESSVTQSRKRPPPDRNGPKAMGSMSGQVESMKPAMGVTPSYADLLKQCESLLGRLMSHKYGKLFDKPVDAVKWKIPDYFTIIKHPMDLGTVKSRLISGQYPSLTDFAKDVRLTFSNAMTYNPATSIVYTMADTLSKYFETRWKPVEKKILAFDWVVVPFESSKPTARVESEIVEQVPPMKKKKIMANETYVKPKPIKRFMTIEEKRRLNADLEALAAELPETIVDFLREQNHLTVGKIVGDEIEIELDFNALKDDTLFKLRKLVDDHMLEKRKTHTMNEPYKEQVDEDVDIIGGIDPLLSSYPPIEFEIADSYSSPKSDTDMSNASDPPKTIKEKQGCDTLERKGGIVNSETGKVCQVEQSSQTNPVIGENAPSKSQVSPKKLDRAAFLCSRYADTILKAEKELKMKQDSNKLKIERKESERQQKEVKARLQAEAKVVSRKKVEAPASVAVEAKRKRELEREAARQALQKMEKVAEEAQRKVKAAASAAVGAKRKREPEREAARQALQKMEKTEDFNGSCHFMEDLENTVDINGNSQFMEDLEMLSCVQDVQLPSFAEVSSAYCPQNGSSNILEQLGLFLKADDDYEEEESPQIEAGPAYDLEEGEIY